MKRPLFAVLACLGLLNSLVSAEDWLRFRGPGGSGVAGEGASFPATWSPSANIAWKTALPGPGASSPIIVGKKAFVTCYSGYGLDQENPGEIENLMRHVVCIDLETGKSLWQKDIKAALPEDVFSGAGVPAHGYASHTPVSDGKYVYFFLGKSGVHAFDLDGNFKWEANVGKESDPTKWGSSSSPILFENTVIVTASCESQSIIGLNKETGKELWRQEAKGLDGMWGTPTLVKVDDQRTDLVMCVAKEMWGLDPSNGKLRWFADATGAEHAYSSVVLDGKRAYAFTGRGGGSIAIDVGGSGDISKTNTVWTGKDNASFGSPVLHKDKLYVISRNVLTVVDAKTGNRVEQLRLKGARPTGGRFGSLDYPSPIVVGDRLFYLNGSGQMYVFELGEKARQISLNQVTDESEFFCGTPAVSQGRMAIRSSKYLYCVMDKGEKAESGFTPPADNATEPEEAGRGGGGGQRGGAGGGGGFNPEEAFNRIDVDKDGKISETELEGNRMADRLKTLDKDSDKSISKEEFTSGIGSLFNQGGGGGGGGGRGGRGGERGEQKDARPDRPQRPAMVGTN